MGSNLVLPHSPYGNWALNVGHFREIPRTVYLFEIVILKKEKKKISLHLFVKLHVVASKKLGILPLEYWVPCAQMSLLWFINTPWVPSKLC